MCRFVGNYERHECGIELRDARVSDGGEWTCVMENYVWGPARGYEVAKSVEINVFEKTTTTTSTTTSITTTSTTTSTTSIYTTTTPHTIMSSTTNECLVNQFKCADNHCIPFEWACDGNDDCGNNSDEEWAYCHEDIHCPNKFKCANDHCVPLGWTCDGENDCGDGSDEDFEYCHAKQDREGEALTTTTETPTTRFPSTLRNRIPSDYSSMWSVGTSATRTTLRTTANHHDFVTRLSPEESTTAIRLAEGRDDRVYLGGSAPRHISQEDQGTRRAANQVHHSKTGINSGDPVTN